LTEDHRAQFGEDVQTSYDRSPVGQATTTPDGSFLRVNQMFLDRTGHTARSLFDDVRRIQGLLTVGARMYYETHLAPILQMHGSAREIALELRGTDGRRLHALANAVLERDADGRPTLIRWAIFVAEERREYERELLSAKEAAEAAARRSRTLVETLQQTLVPASPPQIPGLDVGAAYRPAGDGHEIGGDFYDVFQVAVDDWVVTIGDVQGKGVQAAVVTALARFTIRSTAVEHASPAEVLRALNTALRLDPTDRLCTALVLRLRRVADGWRLRLACGGHPPPLLRRQDGSITELGGFGTLLGIFEHPEIRDAEADLRPGDLLVAYTDGVPDAGRGARVFGEQRLVELLAPARASAGEVVDEILAAVLAFTGGKPRDDIALVGLRCTSDSLA
jgi:sigma-B regulation protein RsbU (phosphoserine phosphatase)